MTLTHPPHRTAGLRLRRAAVALAATVITCIALALTAPVALSFEGQLDPSFGNNGLVLAPVGLANPSPEVYAPAIGNAAETAALSGDNFGGFHFFHLAIFAADGRSLVANNLSASSAAVQDVEPAALVPMPDGLYMAVGHQHSSDGSNQIVLSRFNANGTPDVSFGLQVVPEAQCGTLGNGDVPTGAVFNFNELVVVGRCGAGAGAGGQPGVWEFNEQGQLLAVNDLLTPTVNGLPPGFSGRISFTATAVTGAGAFVYLAGDFAGISTATGKQQDRIILAKYDQVTHSFVTSFGDQHLGYEVYGLGAANPNFFNGTDHASAVSTDAQGLPLLAGSSQGPGGQAFAVARFTTAGAPDQTFGNASQRVIPIGTSSAATVAQADAVAVRSDGKIWLSGTVLNDGASNDNLAVVRLGPTGQDDDTFGLDDNGQQVYPVPSGQFVFGPGAMFVQANGFPLLAEDGEIGSSTNPEFVLARLTSNVCTLCGAVAVQATPSSVTFAIDHEAGGPSMGILVQRLHHGKSTTVGRVPFGPQRIGRVRLKWNREVAGKPLPPGTYLVTVRALDRQGHIVALSRPVRIAIRGAAHAAAAQ